MENHYKGYSAEEIFAALEAKPLTTKKNILDKEKVDSIFDCYNKKVVVDAKVALDSASENN